MDLLKLNIWRKIIIIAYIVSLLAMFLIDWGYHFNIGHVIRLGVGALVFWVVVDRV
ncbi:SpoIIIAC/SpoIIIAD family protein [Pseudodesulfovibrio piezophilus]|uniref:Uncharacterized protein n=1 Tax=Pseudodesulfovibrio piezophilus (strain DSM 21447 / JCM 15486 / C1TLV30) TaxID=1322246 RepID=M1WJC2_PSEP2|nr:SpoIIIAC/SpoIIIAD family protein [Pseudodesulfovibrio piezophilus]CCH47641.1 conserved protein of unknown function [Pseudodesulfovibrio piezophilus C1TLV30]